MLSIPLWISAFLTLVPASTGGNGRASAIKNCLALASRRTSWWLIWWLKSGHEPDKRYTAQPHLTRSCCSIKPRRLITLFDAINWMMTLPEPLERRFCRAIRRWEKEHEMILLNPLQQMFFDDGIQKGIERGLKQVLKQERLLVLRFGALPKIVRSKLARASAAQLEAWSDALVTAQSLKQVFANQ